MGDDLTGATVGGLTMMTVYSTVIEAEAIASHVRGLTMILVFTFFTDFDSS